MRVIVWWLILFSSVFTSVSFASGEVSQSFTVDGRLFDSVTSTLPLLDSSVAIKIQILNPAKTCILYEEQVATPLNTNLTDGSFTVQVGANLRTGSDPGNGMAAVFANSGSVPAVSGSCVGNAYVTSPGASRFLRLLITPSSGASDQLDMVLDSVPSALVAERAENLQGISATGFVQINNTSPVVLTQANLENIFSTASFSALQSLIAGTNNQYLKQSSGAGAALPNYSGNPGTPTAGSVWFDSSSHQIKFFDGTTPQTLGLSGASVTNVTVTSDLTVGGVSAGSISTTGTIGLNPTGVGAGTYPKVRVDVNGRVTSGTTLLEADIPTLSTAGKVSGTAITSGNIATTGSLAITGNNISTTGNGTTTGLITGQTVSSNVSQTNSIKFADQQATPQYATVQAPASVGASGYALTLPATAGLSGQILSSDGTGVLSWVSPNTGSVTSVGLALPSIFNVTTSTVTSSGTLTAALNTQSANQVFAGPTSGGAAAPSFRGLLAADIPNLNWSQITAGTPTTLSGYGITDAVKNAGTTPSIQSGLAAAIPAFGTAGRLYVATDTLKIYRDSGSAWVVVGTTNAADLTGTMNTAQLPTVPVNKGGTGLTSITGNSLVMADGTGSSYIGMTCSLNQLLQWNGTAWACQNVSSVVGTTAFVNGGNSFGQAAILGTNDPYSLALKTSGTTQMTINTSGNVGIGNPSPSVTLDVSGQVRTAVGLPLTNPAGNAVDFATGNTQTVTFTTCVSNALTVNLYTVLEGGSYSLIVTTPASCIVTMTATTASYGAGAGTPVSSFLYSGGGGASASTANASVFSFLRANNILYISQLTDMH